MPSPLQVRPAAFVNGRTRRHWSPISCYHDITGDTDLCSEDLRAETMSIDTCPADFINASVEKVWALLAHPSRYDGWWDAHTTHIDPEGPAVAGQTIHGWTRGLGKRWPVRVQIEAVVADRHQIRFRSWLPLGISAINHISCAAIDMSRCRVQYG